MPGPLKRYPNPVREGAFLKLDEETARRLGLEGPAPAPSPRILSSEKAASGAVSRQEPPAASVGPEGLPAGSGAPSGAKSGEAAPPGALPPGGVTHRARSAVETTPESTEKEEDMAETEQTAAPDAPTQAEPQDKSRPAPTSRRRRKLER